MEEVEKSKSKYLLHLLHLLPHLNGPHLNGPHLNGSPSFFTGGAGAINGEKRGRSDMQINEKVGRRPVQW